MLKWEENIIESIKKINNLDKISDDVSKNPDVKIVEKQKVYFWIRLYMKEEDDDIKIGDDITIKWTISPFDESLKTNFIAYNKSSLIKDDFDYDLTKYENEDDKKTLVLMIDSDKINKECDDIPYIRTLFKESKWYDYHVVRRSELLFIHDKTGKEIEYYDVDF